MKKLNIKKGDLVEVLVGDQNEKGKRAKIVAAFPSDNTVIVEGIFTSKRAVKPRSAQKTGGLVDKPRPVHVSNVMVVCPKCSKATRVGHTEVNGRSARVCRKCDAIIDVKPEPKGKKAAEAKAVKQEPKAKKASTKKTIEPKAE